MLVCPTVALSMYFDKKEISEQDKKAFQLMIRGFGIASTASGVKSLVAEPTIPNLLAAMYMDSAFTVFSVACSFDKGWRDAGIDRGRFKWFIGLGATTVAVMTTALVRNREKED